MYFIQQEMSIIIIGVALCAKRIINKQVNRTNTDFILSMEE